MRRLRASEITSEMGNWAWAVGARLHWQIGKSEGPHRFGPLNVLAVVEVHHDATPSNPVPHDHPGVSLFEADAAPIEHPPASVEYVEGVDVSYYQKGVDWNAVRESGRHWAIVRANADPHLALDPMFKAHIDGATAAGLLVGSYLFVRARYTGREQAQWLIDNTPEPEPGKVLPWTLDVELGDHEAGQQIIDCVAEAVDVLNEAGHKPIIYTMPGFWNGLPRHELAADLWVAHWGVSHPAPVSGWDDWLFWQYASNASVPGYPGHADVNRFRGTIDELRAL